MSDVEEKTSEPPKPLTAGEKVADQIVLIARRLQHHSMELTFTEAIDRAIIIARDNPSLSLTQR